MVETVTIPAAFIFGLLSFFSPCVLPLVPAYLSYMSGASVEELMESKSTEGLRRIGLRAVLFVAGFSVVFIGLGATATTIGQVLNDKVDIIMKTGGIVLVVLGLHMSGVLKIKALYSERRFHTRLQKIGGLGAFLIGVTFAFGWTPCIGPTLAAILALAANSETVGRGVGLLAVYSLGLGVPFLIAGFATGTALKVLARFKKHLRKIEIASGALIIIVGVLVFTGKLAILSSLLSSMQYKGI